MTTYDQVVTRWLYRALGRTDQPQYKHERMPARDDHIYSYGTHFEMAQALRDKKGDLVGFLLNGDTYSPTTTRHQGHVRGAINRSGYRSVIIPHRALHAAGVAYDSVRILDVSRDRNETIYHESYEQPPGTENRWEPRTEPGPMSAEELAAVIDLHHQDRLRYYRDHVDDALRWADRPGHEAIQQMNPWLEYLDGSTPPPGPPPLESLLNRHIKLPGEQGAYYGYFNGTKPVLTHYEHVCRNPKRHGWPQYEFTYQPDGRTLWTWETTKHWLGESLIEGEVDYLITRHCKECRETGRGEGPISADWVEQRVRGWYTDLDGEDKTYFAEWSELRENAWTAPRCPGCQGRGSWSERRRRRTKFLSGFDANEPRPSYFFCELPPHSEATTIEQAYEALKPEAVRTAEMMGRAVKRQGDIFAIPLASATKRSLRKAGARFEPRGQLFGTNHVATETAYLPNGTTICRGTLHHAPARRRPDHHPVALGDWHVVIKNLVPVSA